jgi:pyruvate/2-oxoglutarate dehydrogenase complex dihydrolipoamide dehydrogenase (E3) component
VLAGRRAEQSRLRPETTSEVSVSVQDFDVVVIGMGPGGEDVAETLAQAGLAVAGVESRLVGGECPYWGCVPSKMMIRAANLLAEGRRIPGLAGGSAITPDWSPVARRIRAEATDNWDDKVAADRFIGKGGTLFRGHGTITASTRGRRPRSRRSRVWPGRRCGPTARPSRPRRCRPL